jgi:hypothetical protein
LIASTSEVTSWGLRKKRIIRPRLAGSSLDRTRRQHYHRRVTVHQRHVDEKRFRRDAIARLQDERSKLQNRLDKLYDDRPDGFIEPDFFERKARGWRQTQKRLAD